MKINYTIIIPHKDSHELLQFCLDSIPDREDVQVIVVDDNSNPLQVDFEHFPKWNGQNYELYLTKEGKGAGYCRNVGLEHAKGKWVLFVDADDYVLPTINELFDYYKDSVADIIYFRSTAVMLKDRKTRSDRADMFNSLIEECQRTGDTNNIRVTFESPWSKFIKRDIIVKRNIRFDEIRYGNDVYFSTATACYAKEIETSNDIYYVITQSNNSLTSNFMQKPGELRCRSGAFLRAFMVATEANFKPRVSTAMKMMRLTYRRENDIYCQYFRCIKKYLNCSSIRLVQKVFAGYSRKHLIVTFLYTLFLLMGTKQVNSLQRVFLIQ